jgi:hypothetical protein
MTSDGGTFLLPDQLETDLDRVQAYWNGLKRGDNEIPFWDDVKFSTRARLARGVVLLEVFENRCGSVWTLLETTLRSVMARPSRASSATKSTSTRRSTSSRTSAGRQSSVARRPTFGMNRPARRAQAASDIRV